MDRGVAAKAKEGYQNLANRTAVNAYVTPQNRNTEKSEANGFGAKRTQGGPLTRVTLSGKETRAERC